MLTNTPKSTKKTTFKSRKVILPPLQSPKIERKDSFKSNSSTNSKSPSISTQPSQSLIKSSLKSTSVKFTHPNRRQTFSSLDTEKPSPNKLQQTKGKSMTKLVLNPVIEKQPLMRRTLKPQTFRGYINSEKLLTDSEIQNSTITKLEFKISGFNSGDKGFNQELQEMVSQIDNGKLIHLIIKGDKECKLKDSGIAQLVFNFQKNGKRIVKLELQLNWNDITDIGAKHIGSGLTYMPNLRSLKLLVGHNKFGKKSANSIATGLKSLANLKDLEVDFTNYGFENKMMDEGITSVISSIATLSHLKNLKMTILGQQITPLSVDFLIKALSNKQKLVSLDLDMDFGMNEEYLGIQGSKFEQLLQNCPNLTNLKISRLSFTKNTKQIRSQFFLQLFKQEYLNNISIQYTNGYNFLNQDKNYLDFKNLCDERKEAALHLIGAKHILSKYCPNWSRLTDDLYDVQYNHSSLNNTLNNNDDDNDSVLENYDSFN